MEVLSAAARAARRAVDAATVFLRGAKIQPVAELAARYGAATAAAAAEAAAKDVADANKSSSSRLELAVALLQHHDAITGTARQDVADDYHFRLSAGAHSVLKLLLFASSPNITAHFVHEKRASGLGPQGLSRRDAPLPLSGSIGCPCP